jgi:hypothetical protein
LYRCINLLKYAAEGEDMHFENKHQEETHVKVEQYLGELFDDPYLDEENGHFYVGYGSTILELSVETYGPEETVVLVSAYCVQGVERDEELLLGLLELNHELPVGAFSLVGHDIFFTHAVFGKTLERKNLLGAIAAVATTSDDYDDRIVAKYGGQTALDRIRDTGGRKKRTGVIAEDL